MTESIIQSSLSIYFNTKTNVFTNLKHFNWVKNSISLLLIEDLVSLSCGSGLKEFETSTLKLLAKPLEACSRFVIFTLLSSQKVSQFLSD